MTIHRLAAWLIAGAVFAFGGAPDASAQGTAKLDNATCLSCHDGKKKLEGKDAEGEQRALLAIEPERYGEGVHAKMECVACHKEIVDDKAPHNKKADAPKPNCVQCHTALWDQARKENTAKDKPRLGVVVENIEAYKKSFHAQPAKGKKEPRAYCEDCHNTHSFDVPPASSSERKASWRLETLNRCAEKCHEDALEEYSESVHGQLAVGKKDPKGAVCVDCHTSHQIATTGGDPFKRMITTQCGNCHRENFGSYADTYHGKVNRLGYTYTAQCHDCHGSHSMLKVENPNSKVHPKNKLGTCQQCHDGKKLKEATEGFASFAPHAHAGDLKRYPQVTLMAWFMYALLAGVFAFFWAHSALWYMREYKDRKERRSRVHVRTDEAGVPHDRQIRRFGPLWRLAHLLFAISVMVLVLTGMTVFYADTAWAPVVANALGGPQVTGFMHRVAATVMLGIFFIHLIYMVFRLWKIRSSFNWFGPDSLVPNWKDLEDMIGMFRWFGGKSPKPLFDRWTYWEKFDYWAVFWGMAIIGGSGMMLAFPTETASVLPGWVLNVAALVHGEEAFLAAVFLFTVHFFNNHFRPEKLPPPDVVMFTGSVEVEEFRREHPLQYKRLMETGELQKYLVKEPSRPMTVASKLLGLLLIATGLVLLTLVIVGFFTA